MRIIEHRRHTMRVAGGQHLSQAGVSLARAMGETLTGPFDLVVTSTLPRAFETAIAMGFAVTEQRPELANLPAGYESIAPWDAGFRELARVLQHNPQGAAAGFAAELARLHQDFAKRLPEHGRALVISHGGIVETSAIGCLSGFDFSAWNRACDYCEGVRLQFDRERCVGVEWLRVDDQ